MIPVLRRAGQATQFESQDQADMVQAHLGEQALKAGALLDGAAAPALILVDHHDAFPRPTKGRGIIGQGILTLPRFLVIKDLLRAGLADIDDRYFAKMPVAEGGGAPARCSRVGRRQRSWSRRMAGGVRVAHASPPGAPEAARGVRRRRG